MSTWRVDASYLAGTRITRDPQNEKHLPFTKTERKDGRANLIAFLKRNLRASQDEVELNKALDEAGIIRASRKNGGNYGGRSVRYD